MLLELAKPVALLLCLLSLYALFHTLFFAIEDPQIIFQPHQALDDRVIHALRLFALSAAISLIGGIIFREAEPRAPPRLPATLPSPDLLLGHRHHAGMFFAAWFLETHYIFSPPCTGKLRLNYFTPKVLSIAACASGAIIAYPFAFGCTPSKLVPSFIPPFSSTSAE